MTTDSPRKKRVRFEVPPKTRVSSPTAEIQGVIPTPATGIPRWVTTRPEPSGWMTNSPVFFVAPRHVVAYPGAVVQQSIGTGGGVRWQLGLPGSTELQRFLDAEKDRPFSYPSVGASGSGGVPPGFVLDEYRVFLGSGEAVFGAACRGLREWRQFPSWTRVHPATPGLEQGQALLVGFRFFGLWWLNVCRIVYVTDQPQRGGAFGFAYGTLPMHAERGEERFLVRWNEDDSVVYEIRAFSRPNAWSVRLAYPLARHQQRRFGRESLEAMQACVASRSRPVAP